MRVLLDTNVLISALLFGGLPRVLLHTARRGDIVLVTSTAFLDELESALIGKFGFMWGIVRLVRGEIEALADLVQPADLPRVSRDPDDVRSSLPLLLVTQTSSSPGIEICWCSERIRGSKSSRHASSPISDTALRPWVLPAT